MGRGQAAEGPEGPFVGDGNVPSSPLDWWSRDCRLLTTHVTVYLKLAHFIVCGLWVSKADQKVTGQPPPTPIPQGRRKQNKRSTESREDVHVTNSGILNMLFQAVGVEFPGSSCAVCYRPVIYFIF